MAADPLRFERRQLAGLVRRGRAEAQSQGAGSRVPEPDEGDQRLSHQEGYVCCYLLSDVQLLGVMKDSSLLGVFRDRPLRSVFTE